MGKAYITNYTEYCVICNSPSEAEHHLIPGTASRKKSDKFGLVIKVCNACHNMAGIQSIHGNPKMEAMSKIIGQLAFEKMKVAEGKTEQDARELFRSEFGMSYL